MGESLNAMKFFSGKFLLCVSAAISLMVMTVFICLFMSVLIEEKEINPAIMPVIMAVVMVVSNSVTSVITYYFNKKQE